MTDDRRGHGLRPGCGWVGHRASGMNSPEPVQDVLVTRRTARSSTRWRGSSPPTSERPMNGPWQYALTVGPLGFYLWVLGLWQSGRRPHVVRGLTDFTLLAFGVGGVLAFGPFGQLLARM